MKPQKKDTRKKAPIKDLPAGKKAKAVKGGDVYMHNVKGNN